MVVTPSSEGGEFWPNIRLSEDPGMNYGNLLVIETAVMNMKSRRKGIGKV
jgi:hypothetical protein